MRTLYVVNLSCDTSLFEPSVNLENADGSREIILKPKSLSE